MPGEALERLAVAAADRLVAGVARGHHQRVVRRARGTARRAAASVGSITPRSASPGATSPPTAAPGTRAAPADRRPRRGEQRLVLRRSSATSARATVEVADHHRERLGRPVLALAQPGHRRGVVGAAGELEPAEPLDRDDRAARPAPARAARAPRRPAPSTLAAGPRSHSRGPHAGQHTGSAWKRRSAGSAYSRAHVGAEREARHRGALAVVRQRRGRGRSAARSWCRW